MKHKNKTLALYMVFLASLAFIQMPSVSIGAPNENASDRAKEVAEDKDKDKDKDKDTDDDSSESSDEASSSGSDYYIENCIPGSDERDALCDQLHPEVTEEDFSAYEGMDLMTFCGTWDFDTKGKTTICHKQKVTQTPATRGVCEGHARNHPTDTIGPCEEDDDTLTNEECKQGSSSFYITLDDYAADSDLAAAVDNCDDTLPVDPTTGKPIAEPGATPGRFNWREVFH